MSVSLDHTERLPSWLKERLKSCPVAGDGVHLWLFSTARQLLPHFSEQEVRELLFEGARESGRPLRLLTREIATTVKNALPCRWQPRNRERFRPVGNPSHSPIPSPHFAPVRNWPEPDEAKIRQIVETNFGLVDLFEHTPVRFEDDSHAEEIIDVLFPGDPLLCVGKNPRQYVTRRREVWRGHLARLPLIVPNPMVEFIGQTADGHWSEHTKEKTARRVYLVIEFDFSEFGRDGKTPSRWAALVRQWRASDTTVADACAALHWHLAECLALVCVVHSGGKSVHGWYRAFDRSKHQLRHFMEYAVGLGADHTAWTRSQFVRIPDGLRENGQRQVCYYLDPTKAVNL